MSLESKFAAANESIVYESLKGKGYAEEESLVYLLKEAPPNLYELFKQDTGLDEAAVNRIRGLLGESGEENQNPDNLDNLVDGGMGGGMDMGGDGNDTTNTTTNKNKQSSLNLPFSLSNFNPPAPTVLPFKSNNIGRPNMSGIRTMRQVPVRGPAPSFPPLSMTPMGGNNLGGNPLTNFMNNTSFPPLGRGGVPGYNVSKPNGYIKGGGFMGGMGGVGGVGGMGGMGGMGSMGGMGNMGNINNMNNNGYNNNYPNRGFPGMSGMGGGFGGMGNMGAKRGQLYKGRPPAATTNPFLNMINNFGNNSSGINPNYNGIPTNTMGGSFNKGMGMGMGNNPVAKNYTKNYKRRGEKDPSEKKKERQRFNWNGVDIKLEAIIMAKQEGCQASADKYKVTPQSIRNWLKREAEYVEEARTKGALGEDYPVHSIGCCLPGYENIPGLGLPRCVMDGSSAAMSHHYTDQIKTGLGMKGYGQGGQGGYGRGGGGGGGEQGEYGKGSTLGNLLESIRQGKGGYNSIVDTPIYRPPPPPPPTPPAPDFGSIAKLFNLEMGGIGGIIGSGNMGGGGGTNGGINNNMNMNMNKNQTENSNSNSNNSNNNNGDKELDIDFEPEVDIMNNIRGQLISNLTLPESSNNKHRMDEVDEELKVLETERISAIANGEVGVMRSNPEVSEDDPPHHNPGDTIHASHTNGDLAPLDILGKRLEPDHLSTNNISLQINGQGKHDALNDAHAQGEGKMPYGVNS